MHARHAHLFLRVLYDGAANVGAVCCAGDGRAKQAIFFSLLRKVIIVIPLTFLLPQIPAVGVDGVFWAEVISNFVGGGACYITMLCTVWRELKHKEMGELAQAKK